MTIFKYNLKKHLLIDHRGWGLRSKTYLENLIKDKIADIHLVSIKPGRIRANHYHKILTEWLYLFGGKYAIFWKDSQGKLRKNNVSEKDHFLFKIYPRTKHAVKNIDKKTIFCLAFTNKKYNPKNPDKIDYLLIKE